MRKWVEKQHAGKQVSLVQAKAMTTMMGNLQASVCKLQVENALLKGRLQGRKDVIEAMETSGSTTTTGDAPSFVDIMKSQKGDKKGPPKVTGVRGRLPPAPKIVLIRKEGQTSEDVRKQVQKAVSPKQLGVNVRKVTKVRNGIAVEVDTEEAAKKLMACEEVVKAGMDVAKPKAKQPVVMIYDIPGDLKDDEILEEIHSRNLDGQAISLDDFKDNFRIKHKYGGGRTRDARKGPVHVVAECSLRMRDCLRKQDRIYVGWNCCRVKDYVDIPRCYKCQRFGHVAKHCSNKVACPQCAGEHDFKDCPQKKKEDKLRCANCAREGKDDSKHGAAWRGCPTFQRNVKRYFDSIGYGSANRPN